MIGYQNCCDFYDSDFSLEEQKTISDKHFEELTKKCRLSSVL